MVEEPNTEIHFFSNDTHFKKGYDWYLFQMPMVSPGKFIIEKTPKYFVESKAAYRIHQMKKTIKVLAIFRDPVDRLISDYDHERLLHVERIKNTCKKVTDCTREP